MTSKLKFSFEAEELALLEEVMIEVVTEKMKRLKTPSSIDGFQAYMQKLVDQMDANEFIMTSADNNTLTWLREQIKWCKLKSHSANRLVKILDQAIEERRYFHPIKNTFNEFFDRN